MTEITPSHCLPASLIASSENTQQRARDKCLLSFLRQHLRRGEVSLRPSHHRRDLFRHHGALQAQPSSFPREVSVSGPALTPRWAVSTRHHQALASSR